MKHMKKIASLVLALVMALALAVPAFAAENALPTVTVTAPDNGHTYEIYQIFVGDLDTTEAGKVLSDVKWGQNGTGTEGEAVEQSVLNAIATASGSDLEKLKTIETYWDKNSEPIDTITGGTKNLTTGYYLFVDITKDDDLEDGESRSINVVMLVDPITITDKTNKNTFEKKVKDINDTDTTVYTDWQDSADYDLGDVVPFQLKATLGDNIEEYDEYYVEFWDKLSAGLVYDENSLTIKIVNGDTEKVVTNDFTKEVTKNADGSTTMRFWNDNVKALGATDNSVIIVEYNAQLTGEGVEYGSTGNPNEAKLIYTREPGSKEKGETPTDKVIVFTYKVVVNKVDQDKKPLEGAEFELQKKVKNEDGTESWKTIQAVTAKEGTEFTFNGLDDGEYKLVETKTPDGYNSIADIYFTVTATHTIVSDNPTLTELNGEVAEGTIELEFTPNPNEGSLTAEVVNQSGVILPSTGGIGTTIFYVVGGLLAAGAVILLITKRRMNIGE